MGEGTGLGLSVVHGAVKSMGGEIFVESYLKKGTTFTLYIPVVEEEASRAGHEFHEKEMPMGNQEHILFVDDDISITKVGQRLLEGLNYQVTIMSDSVEALNLFKSNAGSFDVVMADIVMPDMTGDKLAEKVKKIRPDIPVILCTGHHQYMIDKEAVSNNISSICYKPIVKMELATAIRNAIDKR